MYKPALRLGLGLAFVAWISHAHGQSPSEPSSPLTLAQAIERVLEKGPALASARLSVKIAEAEQTQAAVWPNPELALEREGQDRADRSTTWQISQRIELGGKRGARQDVARQASETARADLDSRNAEVRAAVTTAYFGLVVAQERAALAHELMGLARHSVELAQQRVRAGKAAPVEESKARLAEANVRVDTRSAEAELVAARHQLAAHWGNAGAGVTVDAAVADEMPSLPPLEELEAGLPGGPVLRKAQSEVLTEEARARLERSLRTPDVTVSVGAKRDNELGKTQAIVGVSVPLPLFDRNRGNVLAATLRAERAKAERAAAETRIRADLAQAYAKFEAARHGVAILKAEVLPAATSAYEVSAKGFEYGKFPFLDVLDAQRTLSQARAQYWTAVVSLHSMAADIERLTGVRPTYQKVPQ